MNGYLIGSIIGVLYVSSGIVSYGVTLAAFQRKFNFYGVAAKTKWSDLSTAVFAAIF